MRVCAHCEESIQGPPALRWQGGSTEYFHHEDGHMDCYHFATVYGHPTPCADCLEAAKRRYHAQVMAEARQVVKKSLAARLRRK